MVLLKLQRCLGSVKSLPTRCRHGCTCCGSLSREPTFGDTRSCNRMNLPVWFGNTVRCTTLNTHQSELYKLLYVLCLYDENRLFNNLEKRNFLWRERERDRKMVYYIFAKQRDFSFLSSIFFIGYFCSLNNHRHEITTLLKPQSTVVDVKLRHSVILLLIRIPWQRNF